MIFKVGEPIYDSIVTVFAGEPWEEVRRIWKVHHEGDLLMPGPEETERGKVIHPADSLLFYMWLDPAQELMALETILHECGHVAIDIFDHVGIVPSPDTSEALLYLQGYYFKRIVGEIRKTEDGNQLFK